MSQIYFMFIIQGFWTWQTSAV